jgi:tRNA U34 2-thiouridine synthase MnmA/TrmU
VFSQEIENIKIETSYLTKIRGKDEGNFAILREISPNHATIEFNQKVFAPMQGQDVVLYDENNFILFGGRIESFS